MLQSSAASRGFSVHKATDSQLTKPPSQEIKMSSAKHTQTCIINNCHERPLIILSGTYYQTSSVGLPEVLARTCDLCLTCKCFAMLHHQSSTSQPRLWYWFALSTLALWQVDISQTGDVWLCRLLYRFLTDCWLLTYLGKKYISIIFIPNCNLHAKFQFWGIL